MFVENERCCREYVEPPPLANRPDEGLMTREQFEARKAEMRRLREAQRYQERCVPNC